VKAVVSARRVIVQFEFKGLHCWPAIPPDQTEQYLKSEHRHTFKVRVVMPVDGPDRQLEIIAVRDYLVRCLMAEFEKGAGSGTHVLGGRSCEHLAEWFAIQAVEAYPVRWAECEVLEDGECGGFAAVEAQGDE